MLYYFVRLLGTFVIYFLFFPKVIGRKNKHFTGKGLVVSNHSSMWDPLFITVVFRIHIYWMGKIELFKNKILGKLFMAGGAFPIRRGEPDFPAIRHAFRLLREGKVLGLFPRRHTQQKRPDRSVRSRHVHVFAQNRCTGHSGDYPWKLPLFSPHDDRDRAADTAGRYVRQ